MHRTAFLGFVFVNACASATPSAPTTHTSSSAAIEVAPLVYSTTPIESAGGRVLPLALVEVELNGVRTRAVVDTGAQLSAVDATLAQESALQFDSGAIEATDPTGARAASARRTSNAHLRVLGVSKEVMQAVVIDFPAALLESGARVILSPQALVQSADERVEIDFAQGQLRSFTATAPFTDAGRVCSYREEGIEARALVADAHIEERTVLLELDTGATFSSLVGDSELASLLAERAPSSEGTGVGVAGTMQRRIYEGVALQYPGIAASTRVTVTAGQADPHCHYEGRVGFPELRACVVSIGAVGFSITCAATTSAAPPS